MRISSTGKIVLSPTDALRFQSCQHATSLDLRFLRGEKLLPAADDPSAKLVQNKGFEHEARYLEQLISNGRLVVTIDSKILAFEDAHAATASAMAGGADVIFQGALKWGNWAGYADFLERVDTPSTLGSFGYEPVDTKLKRRADAKHALQLSIYARGIEHLQGTLPQSAHIVLGDRSRASFRLEHSVYFSDRLTERVEKFVAQPYATTAEPVEACSLCRWREHCTAAWEESDSLVGVAGIRRSQKKKLEAAGITSVGALSRSTERVPGLAASTLDKLKSQARLQHSRRQGEMPSYQLLPREQLRGFELIPRPSNGDLFFDMEGDPLIEGGLEYLFGIYEEASGSPRFKSFWAHDEAQEKLATCQVLEYFVKHLASHPDAFIYHYNHYEVTALKRLTSKYGVAEHLLDHLLRTQRFVDLYKVVRQGLITSEPGLSIKDLEVFYRPKREGDVQTAGASIVAYEEWRDTVDDSILAAIESYNEIDCISTKGLRDWLLSLRPADVEWFRPTTDLAVSQPDDPIRNAMQDFIEPARARLGDSLANLLLELNSFHKRADKPAWWEYFDRQQCELEQLIDDLECLAGLMAISPAAGRMRVYEYPAQQTKLRENDRVAVRGSRCLAKITGIDRVSREVTVEFSKNFGPPPTECDLTPGKPLANEILRKAVRRAVASIVNGSNKFPAIEDFLHKRRPRIRGVGDGAAIISGSDVVGETVQAIVCLDRSCLPVQGPPGTGKTYVSSCAILELVRQGRRVAVSSNSHKAIDNLLAAVAARAREARYRISISKKVSSLDEAVDDPSIYSTDDNADPALFCSNVVGGTAWLFAREKFEQHFDVLFVDEAGQVAIANIVAMATAARNIVLVGDQMQLPQPVQGVHPENSGMSSLEYLIGDVQTIANNSGVFLPISRRLHPSVCEIVSKIAYEGRLTSDEGAKKHRLIFDDDESRLPSAGVLFFDVEHERNGQTSEEEAAALGLLYASLLRAQFVDRNGLRRFISVDDILVVSPYNAQVNLLKERLPPGARVGTVDRFQGQEAPACLISMATSSAEEMPRDLEFLFSLNRLNVALSRAQALAAVLCSPRLLEVECNSLEQLRLVNALCAVRSYSQQLRS